MLIASLFVLEDYKGHNIALVVVVGDDRQRHSLLYLTGKLRRSGFDYAPAVVVAVAAVAVEFDQMNCYCYLRYDYYAKVHQLRFDS